MLLKAVVAWIVSARLSPLPAIKPWLLRVAVSLLHQTAPTESDPSVPGAVVNEPEGPMVRVAPAVAESMPCSVAVGDAETIG